MSNHLPALIFDLDGTLTDSKPGIVGCLGEVLATRHILYAGSLERFVGPPVEEWTVELLPDGSDEERAALVRDYRGCYDREGWRNNSVFPGVRDMLAELEKKEFSLYVCTSKPQHFAVRILDHFELSRLFKAIYGDQPEFASHSKVDLLERLLREQSIKSETAWMIGDRIYDFEAAHANGIRCLAAGWGYGNAEEYAAGDAISPSPGGVLRIVSGSDSQD